MQRRNFLRNLSIASVGASVGAPLQAKARVQKTISDRPVLHEKIEAAVYAFVVADAMGGSIENGLPQELLAKFGSWDFGQWIPPQSKKDIETGKGKGNGRTTDDSINFEVLINIYHQHQDHLDAYSYADLLVKEHNKKVYIAERGETLKIVDRPLWWPERYVYQRLAINNVEPRYAGMGNYINEGFQGIVLPVGAVNASDPWRAYNECVGLGMAHTESFGVEAAAVNAAAYATAFAPSSTLDDVLATALRYAKDGSAMALKAVLAATNPSHDLATFITNTRKAVLPYLQLPPDKEQDAEAATPKLAHEHSNIARPSRIGVVENFPIALACLKFGQGDYATTLKASLLYGRDGETIAAVSTSLLAAILAKPLVPEALRVSVNEVNKRDFAALAADLYSTAKLIHEKDFSLLAARNKLF